VFVEKFAGRAGLEVGARAAAGYGASCSKLSKKSASTYAKVMVSVWQI
jgi:hypothetical protein